MSFASPDVYPGTLFNDEMIALPASIQEQYDRSCEQKRRYLTPHP